MKRKPPPADAPTVDAEVDKLTEKEPPLARSDMVHPKKEVKREPLPMPSFPARKPVPPAPKAPMAEVAKVPLRVFAAAGGVRWEQLAGFRNYAKRKKLGPMSMAEWRQALEDFRAMPV